MPAATDAAGFAAFLKQDRKDAETLIKIANPRRPIQGIGSPSCSIVAICSSLRPPGSPRRARPAARAGAGGQEAGSCHRRLPGGGGTDVTARVLAEAIRGPYASTVLVENKPGASARIAVDYVSAEPDGSVMLFTPDFPMTLYPHSFKSLSYDPLKDFTPVGPATTSMLSYNVGPAVPASSRRSPTMCMVQGQSRQGELRHHLGRRDAAFRRRDAVQRVEGADDAGALQWRRAGLAGCGRRHIPMSVNPLSEALPLHQAGTVRAWPSPGRSARSFMPDVPTAKESGYDVVVNLARRVPAAKAPASGEALSTAMKEASQSAAMKDSLAKFASEATSRRQSSSPRRSRPT